MRMSRRALLLQSAKLAPAARLLAGTKALTALPGHSSPPRQQASKLKVVITGGHPGDPECGCGGTIARYSDAGHHVALLYLNRGEGYCGQNDTKDCAQIRTAEAEKACAILKAHALFAAQTDGRAVVDPPHYEEFSRLLLAQEPHIVFTHWPTDAHRDHRAISALVLDAWLASKKKFALYYYEVAEDTMRFSATDFVDTSGVADLHRAACYAHASQQPNKWFPLQVEMIRYHGLQAGCAQAEAFYGVSQQPQIVLP